MSAITYPLDTVGTSVLNLVTNEVHNPIMGSKAVFAIDSGSYYADSMVVTDAHGTVAKIGVDWYPSIPDEMITGISKKLCCHLVVLTNSALQMPVTVQYQTPGGGYNYVAQVFVDAFYRLGFHLLAKPWSIIFYNALTLPPIFFEYSKHQADQGIQVGFEYLITAMNRIADTLMYGDIYAHEVIRVYATDLMKWHLAQPDPHPQYLMKGDYVGMPSVYRPKNLLPLDNTTDIAIGTTLKASTYYALYGAVQTKSQYQVSTDLSFIGAALLQDVTKTSDFTVASIDPSIPPNTKVYWRVRYANSLNEWSQWSIPTAFTVGSNVGVSKVINLVGVSSYKLPSDVNVFSATGRGSDGGVVYIPPSSGAPAVWQEGQALWPTPAPFPMIIFYDGDTQYSTGMDTVGLGLVVIRTEQGEVRDKTISLSIGHGYVGFFNVAAVVPPGHWTGTTWVIDGSGPWPVTISGPFQVVRTDGTTVDNPRASVSIPDFYWGVMPMMLSPGSGPIPGSNQPFNGNATTLAVAGTSYSFPGGIGAPAPDAATIPFALESNGQTLSHSVPTGGTLTITYVTRT